ncbi:MULTISPECIES: asparagine synthase (glutamine-hydrolyzing) [Niastella]|uniref:asparagine synthase (glutamine-hydrolyzing) n=1 Tax=Niastella soli TaxID=2821487 RepID=A0ABS3YQG7_9BACT|nr:asparagine synthase (glutamine-hydrolyzing) [Niastella soli]MBO9200161.1 asparagine synthase (glutamine-hydrolyzing) [Niastella soli]
MCGIAGIFSFKQSVNLHQTIRLMTNAMAHRGPDSDGFYTNEIVALGHRRLSIIDLSTAANQPIADYTGRYQIIFNGEIYNFQEVKKMLPEYPFSTNSDTEVLLAAYSKWGPECLPLLKGMFAFAIWDTTERELFIARDRMGVKPVYYFTNENVFLFASEIRGILGSGIVERNADALAIREFLSYQSVGSGQSAIQNIVQLEAGSYITIRGNKVSINKYWEITGRPEIDFDFGDTAMVQKQVQLLLRNAVERRLISDVPLGAFLSGGIDSSVVVGLMAEVSSTPVNTFNVAFEEKEFDESEYARIISRKFNTNHNQVLLKPDVFLDELTNALDAMDTPSGDGINTYVVSKAIKQSGLTVALSGIGGDELFAGYPFFKQYLQVKKYQPIWQGTGWLRSIAGSFLGNTNKALRMKQLLKAPANSIRYFYPEFRRIITPSLLASLVRKNSNDLTSLEKELAGLPSSLEKFPLLSQVSIAEYTGYTQHTLLKDMDQFSMAVSLEAREPFFDHDLVEFVLAVPDHIKFPQYSKRLLVESVQGLLPDEIVHRKKQGFLFPWSIWMKNELRSFCETRLQRIAQRDFINGKDLLAYWQRFLNNDSTVRWMELWLFVILEYWMEKNSIH